MTTHYGATPQEWAHFDLSLGLTADLLPVVSNPNAAISPDSKMKSLGKTPSRYNSRRQVAGIKDWTQKQATEAEVDRWSREPDYGICIQTRTVRALDIDIDDVDTAAAVRRAIFDCGVNLPVRLREASGKCLLAFRLPGDMAKRVIRTETGLIEFLATGQQFVAAGTHTSGARYQWQWEQYGAEFPDVDLATFEYIWGELARQFAVSKSEGGTLRQRGDTVDMADARLAWLHDRGLVLDEGRDGQAYITCPWKDGHSCDSGVTETAYFPAGTNGYMQGHFKCLHASCAARTDNDYEHALGYVSSGFALVESSQDGSVDGAEPEWPSFIRNKQGIVPGLENTVAALRSPDWLGAELCYDEFEAAEVIRWKGEGWRVLDNADPVRMRLFLEQMGLPVARETMRDTITLVASERKFDSAQAWLAKVPEWDGIPRVGTFLSDYFGVPSSKYASAVGEYIWSTLAGRVIEPGIKADMMPILVGSQGARKSSAVIAMVPSEDQFVEIDLNDKEENLARCMRGKLIAEVAELKGLNTRDAEHIKAFITRRREVWVEKYKERATKMDRRLLFIGTSNEHEILDDPTGSRRFLPVVVGDIDTDGIVAVRDQLWAEGRKLFKANGIMYRDAERLAKAEHSKFELHDVWKESIEQWLNTPDMVGELPSRVTTLEVALHAIGVPKPLLKRPEQLRIVKALRRIGWTPSVYRVDGVSVKGWVKT